VAVIVVALLGSGAGQAASKADVTVAVTRGTAPGQLDWQLADQSFTGLNSVRFQLQGQTIPSITCPSGWTSQVSPTSGASCSGGSLGPGQTMAGSFTFGGSLPPTAGLLTIGNASGTEQITFTISGSGGSEPCQCVGVSASIDPKSIKLEVHYPRAFVFFKLHWKLDCTPGSSGDCSARLHVRPSANGEVLHSFEPPGIVVTCRGPCGGVKSGTTSTLDYEAFFPRGTLPKHALAGNRIRVRIVRDCGADTTVSSLWIAFDDHGRPDPAKSKLH
jgi:hypothetical protein